jgi:hypothetical protein
VIAASVEQGLASAQQAETTHSENDFRDTQAREDGSLDTLEVHAGSSGMSFPKSVNKDLLGAEMLAAFEDYERFERTRRWVVADADADAAEA